jgi:hypothetical protein
VPLQSVAFGHYGQHVSGIEQPMLETTVYFRKDSEVDVSSLQPRRQADSAILNELDINARMAPLITREESHHHALNQLRCGTDLQHAGVARFEGMRPLTDCLGIPQQPATALKQVLALGCQSYAAPDAIEQLHAKFDLKRIDLPRGGGLAEIDPGRRPADAAGIRNRDEGP